MLIENLAWHQDYKTHESFALYFVRHSNSCRLCHFDVLDQDRLDFPGADALAGHFYSVIGSSEEKPLAILIYFGPITVVPNIWEFAEISFQISFRIFEKALGHGRARFFADKMTDRIADAVAGLVKNINIHTEPRSTQRTSLQRHNR